MSAMEEQELRLIADEARSKLGRYLGGRILPGRLRLRRASRAMGKFECYLNRSGTSYLMPSNYVSTVTASRPY